MFTTLNLQEDLIGNQRMSWIIGKDLNKNKNKKQKIDNT